MKQRQLMFSFSQYNTIMFISTSRRSSTWLLACSYLSWWRTPAQQTGTLSFCDAQQVEIEMIYLQEVADILFAEQFEQFLRVSFECSNSFKSFPTLKGNK